MLVLRNLPVRNGFSISDYTILIVTVSPVMYNTACGVWRGVWCSENIRDLLNPKNNQLRVRETPAGEVLVQGLLEEYCAGEEDILKLIELGEKSRSVASTEVCVVVTN